jgi:hypothetical protein
MVPRDLPQAFEGIVDIVDRNLVDWLIAEDRGPEVEGKSPLAGVIEAKAFFDGCAGTLSSRSGPFLVLTEGGFVT